jgi:hypothetical protein
MPAYRDRDGDVVYNAPYRATYADLNAFVFSADTACLQKLIDSQLNTCVRANALPGSQQGLSFACPEPWVVFIYATFRALGSADEVDRRRGFVGAFELSIWLPITKRQNVAGTVTTESAWYLPLVYTAPTASVVTGREVYGYPKVPAFLALPPGGGPPIGVRVLDPTAPFRAHDDQSGTRDDSLFRINNDALPIDPDAECDYQAVLRRYLANVPLIFLKQVGLLEEKHGARAGYSALLEGRVPITRLQHIEVMPEVGTLRHDPSTAPVVAALGLRQARPLFGVAVRGCTVDVQHGREIWVAEGNAAYVPPLKAPGNDLLRAPEPASPNVDTVEGTGEVYFAPARPRAIAALLEHDFPDRVEGTRPTPDKSRNEVLLTFVRASSGADVKLYEFAVWVPVMHEDVRAWYVPYMFRSPGAAVVQAREWNGHPCQEGFIVFDGTPDGERIVNVRQPVPEKALGVEWVKQSGIVLKVPKSPPNYDAFGPEPSENDLLAGGEQHIVALFQVRHVADTSRACVQRVVHSRRRISAKKAGEPLYREVVVTAPGRLGRLLDLDGRQNCVRGWRLDELRIVSRPSSLTWEA